MVKILTFAPQYLPGYKAGGPIKSLANMFASLGDEFEFLLVTSDRDLGDAEPYHFESLPTDGVWRPVGKVKVCYLPPSMAVRLVTIYRILRSERPDLIYLNSFFSTVYSIFPIWLQFFRLTKRVPVLIAPRGEFSDAALEIKSRKKTVYRWISGWLSECANTFWHASSDFEASDISRNFGVSSNSIFIASDLPSIPKEVSDERPEAQYEGEFKVCFLSRIAPIKNLDFCLQVLKDVERPVAFNIFGPTEDSDFLRVCQEAANALPNNVTVRFQGAVSPNDVPFTLTEHDLLFLPSKGENFAHVIAESLSVGTEVLISDRTPWRRMQDRGLGREFSLNKPEHFADFINHRSAQSLKVRRLRRHEIRAKYANEITANRELEKNRNMFLRILRNR